MLSSLVQCPGIKLAQGAWHYIKDGRSWLFIKYTKKGMVSYSKIPLVSQIIISKGKCICHFLSAEGLGNSTKTLLGNDKT
jgi:hypothetical protein